MKFRMKLPVVVIVEVTVQTEDNNSSYRISGLRPPSAAAFTRALSSDDAALCIEQEIAGRVAAKQGVVG